MSVNKSGCGFCSREGLPILLVRPGVADQQDTVPDLPESVVPPVAAQGHSKYTGRLLREGYLHVYDEMINLWTEYYVTAKGYYYPLPGSGDVPPRLLSGEMTPCISQPEELAMASLITLPVMPPPMPNGVYWFGWSENKWTPAVKKMHQDPAVRQKMMQRFDMDAWINSGQGDGVLPVSQLPGIVAEYSRGTSHAEINDYSASYFQPAHLTAENVIQAAEKLKPGKGAILVLQDPIAMLQEISSLLSYQTNRDLYCNDKYLWKLTLASTLTGLKESMTRQMARDLISRSDFTSMNEKLGVKTATGLDLLPSPALADQRNAHLEATLKNSIDEKWQTYAKYYDEQQVAQFIQEFNEAVNQYDQQVVIPETEMYLAWLKSDIETNYFRYNFDVDDIQSGFDYTQTVGYCIAGMQDKALVSRYITAQLKMKANDYNNILMRALVLNQDKMSDRISALFQDNSSLWSQPWNGFSDAFKDTFDKMQEAAAGYLGAFFGIITGNISQILHTAANKQISYQLFCMLSASGQRAFIPVKRMGTEAEFIEDIVRVMARNAGVAAGRTEDNLRAYVKWEVRRLGIDGLDVSGSGERNYIAAIDIDEFNTLAALPENQRIARLSRSLRTQHDVDRLLFTRWQTHISETFSSVKKSIPLALGAVSMALQTAALWVSMDFSHKPMTTAQQEARNRFWAGTVSLTGTTAGTIETAIVRFNRLGAAFPGSAAEKIAKWFGVAGRFLGAGGGVVAAYYDVIHAKEEWNKNRKGLSFAYRASAVSGLYLAFAPFINWKWLGDTLVILGSRFGSSAMLSLGASMEVIGLTLGWAAVGIFLIAAFYISWKQTNELQQWLEKTMWGETPEGVPPVKHPTMQIEMQSLKDIMQAE
ncbi:T6SS effector BTH_I2691 family protein [Nissabacter archeti]|uniref:T6SS effector BTH_I2691 family protein n=1 Tax=Nissabacter archeti TaxID=1917880 RepID=UPI00111515F8|nr:T6SS effector BTH_I2691 family protein [Nissabacter archeti]